MTLITLIVSIRISSDIFHLGNYYGTPKPLRNNYLVVNDKVSDSSKSYLPGIHPSSEGKRKRNRSNVEAMAAKDLDHNSVMSNGQDRKGTFSRLSFCRHSVKPYSHLDEIFRRILSRYAEENST